jgi:phage major head subunit gpT-like protein
MGEQSYTNKANPYGKLFAISYEDLVNDDLGAFDNVRRKLGRGAALAMNTVFWTEFLADVTTFYTSGRANYFEGSSSALSITSLSTAVQMFGAQTDPDGNPLGLMPAILLTPWSLNETAANLLNSNEIRDTNGSKVYTTRNPHAGKFRSVTSQYLNASAIPNGSATHWFLLADPMDMAVIEMVFLNGRQEPIVEAANADFDTLGVQMRGYHSFGASKQEDRGGVRSKGAA